MTATKARCTLRKARLFRFIPVAVWLFIQMVMTGVWSTGASAIGSPEYAGQAIVICTGDGLVTIYLDENGNPVEDGSKPPLPCTWCVGFSAPPTLIAPIDPLAFVPGDAGCMVFAWVEDHLSAQETITNALIRAPPIWAYS